jgi:hypothetical protein
MKEPCCRNRHNIAQDAVAYYNRSVGPVWGGGCNTSSSARLIVSPCNDGFINTQSKTVKRAR